MSMTTNSSDLTATATTSEVDGVVRIVRKQAYSAMTIPSTSRPVVGSSGEDYHINSSTSPTISFKPKHRQPWSLREATHHTGRHAATVIGVVLDANLSRQTASLSKQSDVDRMPSSSRPVSDHTDECGRFRPFLTTSSGTDSTSSCVGSYSSHYHHPFRSHRQWTPTVSVNKGGGVKYRSVARLRPQPTHCQSTFHRLPVHLTRVGGIELVAGPRPDVPLPITTSSTPNSPPPTTSSIIRIGPGTTITRCRMVDQHSAGNSATRYYYSPLAPSQHFDDEELAKSAPTTTSAEELCSEHSYLSIDTRRMDFDSSSFDHQPKTAPPTTSSGAAHIARTIRHLRRMRHMYGDPLTYPPPSSSIISASTGALPSPTHQSVIESSRSVESVCDTLTSSSSPFVCNCRLDSPSATTDDTGGYDDQSPTLVRFATELKAGSTSWQRYQLKVVSDQLIMTRMTHSSYNDSDTNIPTRFKHLHVSLADSQLDWNCSPKLSNQDPALSNKRAICCHLTSGDRLECDLLFDDRKHAWQILGRWAAPSSSTPHHRTTPTRRSPARAAARHNLFRSNQLFTTGSGRTMSLGLAGPPGAHPLMQAIGAAAASIGLKLDTVASGDASRPSFHSDTKTDGDEDGGDKHEEKQHRSTGKQHSRGRFHQALNRMRRAATAVYTGTTRSSRHEAKPSSRRFASSHAALFGGFKPHSNSPPPPPPDPSSMHELSLSDQTTSSSTNVNQQPIIGAFGHINQQQPSHAPLVELIASPQLQDDRPSRLRSMLPQPQTPVKSSDSVTTTEYQHQGQSNSSLSPPPQLTSMEAQQSFESCQSCDAAVIQQQETHLKAPPPFVPLPGPVALHVCPRSTLSPFVPFLVEFCVTIVERYGLHCVGIYRVSGSKLAHDFISTELQKDIHEVDVVSDKWNDIHAVCGVLKMFLRNLPDSLFPKVMYPDFMAACRHSQREKRLLSIQRLLGIMECYPNHPEYRTHRATLRYLATHLARVSARQVVNKMTAYNLALVFAPNLVQPCEDRPELLMTDSKCKIMLVEMVIKYHEWIFSPDLGIESGCSVPPDSSEDVSLAGSQLDVASVSCPASQAPPSDASSPPATTSQSLPPSTPSIELDEPSTVSLSTYQPPDRVEGDVQSLVVELLNAAANLPPPPSTSDLETAEIPGPESDRPSDIAAVSQQNRPTLAHVSGSTGQTAVTGGESSSVVVEDVTFASSSSLQLSPIKTQDLSLDLKLEDLRNLSQECLQEYSPDARRLVDSRVAECRRQLEQTIAQRKRAEQLLMEAKSDSQLQLDQPSLVGGTSGDNPSSPANDPKLS